MEGLWKFWGKWSAIFKALKVVGEGGWSAEAFEICAFTIKITQSNLVFEFGEEKKEEKKSCKRLWIFEWKV